MGTLDTIKLFHSEGSVLYRFAGFTYDSDRHELARPDGEVVPLPGKAELLLQTLLDRSGVTVSREQLLEAVWPDVKTTEASLRRAAYLVRQALDVHEDGAPVLATIRGRGYRIDVPVTVVAPSDPAAAGVPAAAHQPASRRPWVGPTALAGSLLFLLLLVLGRPIEVDAPESGSESAPLARPVTSVAVLPFDVPTERDGRPHLGEGMAEEVVRRLALVPSLHVIGSRSSSTIPTGTTLDDIGRMLGVGSVLRGDLRDDGERLHITVELLRVEDDQQVFARTFEVDSSDLFAAQDDIAKEIVASLSTAVEDNSPLHITPRHQPDPRAYDHFLRGSTAQQYRSYASATRTVEHFERAVALDPAFAEAWAELSRALSRFAFHVHDRKRYEDLVGRADATAHHALSLDPSSGLAHAAVAGALRHRGDMAGAADALRKAVDLEPGYAALIEDYSMTLVRLGRLEEAKSWLVRLVDRDPLSPLAHRQLGRTQLYLGQPEQAIRSLLRCLELNPADEDAPRLLSDAHAALGRELQAGEVLIRTAPWSLRAPARVGLRLLGMQRMARITYQLLRWRTGADCLNQPYAAAGFLAAGGDREGMFHCLDEADPTMLTFVGFEPVFAPYRKDPRFATLVERAGMVLPENRRLSDRAIDPAG